VGPALGSKTRFSGVRNFIFERVSWYVLGEFEPSADTLNIVSQFFQENQRSWESLVAVGVCTDRAPDMIGLRSGFTNKVKEIHHFIVKP